MSLKSRITRSLLIMFVLAASAQYAIQRYWVIPDFLALERSSAEADLQRSRQAIDRELALVDVLCREWASRPQLPTEPGPDGRRFIDTATSREALLASRLNAVYFFDREGRVLRGDVRVDHVQSSVFVPELGFQRFSSKHPLLGHLGSGGSVSGVIPTSLGPMLTASRALSAPPGSALSPGTLVVGRFLDERALAALVAQARVNLRVWAVSDPGIDEEGAAALQRFREGEPCEFHPLDAGTLRAYAAYPGLDGAPAVLLRADIPRTFMATARSLSRFASLTLLAAGIVHMVVLRGLLNRGVVAPLLRLCGGVASISGGEDLSRRLRMRRRDEIGLLALEFDRMMGRLERVHDRLRHAALHDELTALPNRAWILERLKVCMERTRRDPKFTFALLFLDIDKFKNVNDTLGHDAGDELLRQIAGRLRECVRATDAVARAPRHDDEWMPLEAPFREACPHADGAGAVSAAPISAGMAEDGDEGEAREGSCVARLGGDEFLVLLEDVRDASEAGHVAQRIRDSMATPFQLDNESVRSGASVGMVLNTPFTTADEMLQAADASMYRAKAATRALARGVTSGISNT